MPGAVAPFAPDPLHATALNMESLLQIEKVDLRLFGHVMKISRRRLARQVLLVHTSVSVMSTMLK